MDKKKVTIVTHNGSFHADEILGTATLFLAYEKDYTIEVVRTRDVRKINTSDIVLDVGGVYDPNHNRFDHHQTGGAGIRVNGIPYAAFGLVWKKYGTLVAGNKKIADNIENKIVLGIDALDNGLEINTRLFNDVELYSLGDVFSAYRPTWKEDRNELDSIFMKLVEMAKEILKREIKKSTDKEEAKNIISEMYKKLENKKLLILDTYYPWDSVSDEIEETLVVVFPDTTPGQWCAESTRIKGEKFKQKVYFPKEWGGKRGEELAKISGVPDAVFCHTGLFFVVAKTKEAILKLVDIAINS